MAWVNLVIAGIFEVIWAISLKYSQSFSRLLPSIITIAGMIVSFFFLSLATKSLPIGTAYAVWTGIGAVGTILLGILLFHEPISLLFQFAALLGLYAASKKEAGAFPFLVNAN